MPERSGWLNGYWRDAMMDLNKCFESLGCDSCHWGPTENEECEKHCSEIQAMDEALFALWERLVG